MRDMWLSGYCGWYSETPDMISCRVRDLANKFRCVSYHHHTVQVCATTDTKITIAWLVLNLGILFATAVLALWTIRLRDRLYVHKEALHTALVVAPTLVLVCLMSIDGYWRW